MRNMFISTTAVLALTAGAAFADPGSTTSFDTLGLGVFDGDLAYTADGLLDGDYIGMDELAGFLEREGAAEGGLTEMLTLSALPADGIGGTTQEWSVDVAYTVDEPMGPAGTFVSDFHLQAAAVAGDVGAEVDPWIGQLELASVGATVGGIFSDDQSLFAGPNGLV